MASTTPTKSKINVTKSNTAKSSLLKTSKRFDYRLIGLIVVLLVVVVGYLFIRFSKAATTTKDYVYEFSWNSVRVYDPNSNTPLKEIFLSLTNPTASNEASCGGNLGGNVVANAVNRVFIYQCDGELKNKVAVIDTSLNKLINIFDITPDNHNNQTFIVNPAKRQFYIQDQTDNDDHIGIYNMDTGVRIRSITVDYPSAIVVSSDGNILTATNSAGGAGKYKVATSYSTSTWNEIKTLEADTVASPSFGGFGQMQYEQNFNAIPGTQSAYVVVNTAFNYTTRTHDYAFRRLNLSTLAFEGAPITVPGISAGQSINPFSHLMLSNDKTKMYSLAWGTLCSGKYCYQAIEIDIAKNTARVLPGSNFIQSVADKNRFSSDTFTQSNDGASLYISGGYSAPPVTSYNLSTGIQKTYPAGMRAGGSYELYIVRAGMIETTTPTPTPTATPAITQAPGTSAPTSTGTWTADKLLLVKGTLTTKADGAKQITSVKEGNWSVSHFSLENVAADTYCVSGTAPAGSYSQIVARYDELGRTVADPAQLSPLAAGAFETCAGLAARPADQPTATSHVFVQIYSPAATPTTVDKMYVQSASTNPAPASSS